MAKNIGVILFENAQPMDVIGPWEVFSMWKQVAKQPLNLYLIAEKVGPVNCSSNIILQAHVDFESSPQMDYLVVVGGSGRLKQVNNKKLISFVKQQAINCEYIISICTGVFLLERTGLLDGHDATTYWPALPEAIQFDKINWVGKRIVKSGNIWVSGGVTSGIDIGLEFVAEIDGPEIAGAVQLMLEYFPEGKNYTSDKTITLTPKYNENDTINNRIIPDYIKTYLKK